MLLFLEYWNYTGLLSVAMWHCKLCLQPDSKLSSVTSVACVVWTVALVHWAERESIRIVLSYWTNPHCAICIIILTIVPIVLEVFLVTSQSSRLCWCLYRMAAGLELGKALFILGRWNGEQAWKDENRRRIAWAVQVWQGHPLKSLRFRQI